MLDVSDEDKKKSLSNQAIVSEQCIINDNCVLDVSDEDKKKSSEKLPWEAFEHSVCGG